MTPLPDTADGFERDECSAGSDEDAEVEGGSFASQCGAVHGWEPGLQRLPEERGRRYVPVARSNPCLRFLAPAGPVEAGPATRPAGTPAIGASGICSLGPNL